jgi:DNA-directed RNA polymerase specialized sigma24 family protein
MESREVADLVRRCADGVHSDWEELNRLFGCRLESGVRGALGRAGVEPSAERVEDLLQEVYCRLWERRGHALRRFRGVSYGEAAAYLHRLAENVGLDCLRARQAQKRGGGRRLESLDARSREVAVDPSPSPEAQALASERRHALRTVCRRAAAGGQERRDFWILQRVLLDGWSPREISRVLRGRLAVAGVEALIYRVRRRLGGEGLVPL